MKIVVLGATGQTGQHLVNQALQQGHSVTAVVRNPGKMTVSHDNLKVTFLAFHIGYDLSLRLSGYRNYGVSVYVMIRIVWIVLLSRTSVLESVGQFKFCVMSNMST